MSRAILLLDDDEWLAETYQLALIQHGYSVYYAHDAQSALNLLDHHKEIELGIIDLMLSGPSGISFLYEVVSQLDWQKKRFIVMSHHDRREVCEEPFIWDQLNVNAYLYKPTLQPADVVRAVEKVFE